MDSCVILVEFDIRLGPVLECMSPADVPFVEHESLGEEIKSKVPFWALPDRADDCDAGFTYFLVRQAPEMVVGVSCFRQIESVETSRHKMQRALCVLSSRPYFYLVRMLLESVIDDIVWMPTKEERLDKVKRLRSQLEESFSVPRVLTRGDVCGPECLSTVLRWLGGGKAALVLLKCILLGNTGVIITAPSSEIASQVVLVLASVLPGFGGLLGDIPEDRSDSKYSGKCLELIGLSMASDLKKKSKMLFMPYSSLMEVDDIRAVYAPRKKSVGTFDGRCGYLAGATNPALASKIQHGLGDLICELSDQVKDETWMSSRSLAPTKNLKSSTTSEEEGEEEEDHKTQLAQQFQAFSSKAAKFMKETTGQVVNKFNQWTCSPVNFKAITTAGSASVDLGIKDREFVKKINKVLYNSRRSAPTSPKRDPFSSFFNSLVQTVSVEAPLYAKIDKQTENLDQALRELLVLWVNSVFSEMNRYAEEVVGPNVKLKDKFFFGGHNRAYLYEWSQRTQTTRDKKACSEIVRFENGDEYRGELLLCDSQGFVDVRISSDLRGRRLARHGYGVYTSKKWRYEGTWEDDARSGHGTISLLARPDDFIYDGTWSKDMRCGQGTCIVTGVGQYSGSWSMDRFDGEGMFFDVSGNSYQGSWKGGKRDGEGVFQGANGEMYQGEWRNDVPEGVGNATYRDGSKYSGEWKEGKRDGQGVWSKGDEVASGRWDKDHLDGFALELVLCLCNWPMDDFCVDLGPAASQTGKLAGVQPVYDTEHNEWCTADSPSNKLPQE